MSEIEIKFPSIEELKQEVLEEDNKNYPINLKKDLETLKKIIKLHKRGFIKYGTINIYGDSCHKFEDLEKLRKYLFNNNCEYVIYDWEIISREKYEEYKKEEVEKQNKSFCIIS
jgi:hypothetical protein